MEGTNYLKKNKTLMSWSSIYQAYYILLIFFYVYSYFSIVDTSMTEILEHA